MSKEAVNVGERTGVDSERLKKAKRRIERAEMGAEEEFGKEKEGGNDRSFSKCFIFLLAVGSIFISTEFLIFSLTALYFWSVIIDFSFLVIRQYFISF